MVGLVLLVVALVLLILATLGVPSPPRMALGWAGLAFFVGYFLATALKL